MADLSTVTTRDTLKPGREPHWQRLAVGQYLGYRPLANGKGGNWIARYNDKEARKQYFRSLGDFGSLSAKERFSAASAAAREWFSHLDTGGSPEVLTVRQACERYAASNPDAAARFPRYVYDDPIAAIKLLKLTKSHVLGWRKRLEDLPAKVTRSKRGTPVTRTRAPATLNRDMVPFRAALNLALKEGAVTTDRAWKEALSPLVANSRRTTYLDRDQRQALLKHASEEMVPLLTALCLLPLRPGAAAALLVGDFDARQGTLTVNRDKAGEGRKLGIPEEAAALLKDQCRLKLPSAPIFTRGDGKAWNKDSWKKPMKAAVRAANLPEETTAYTLRHSTITDLVQVGLPLLTIAQLSGTSATIIERHYGHLQQAQAVKALATLSFGGTAS